METLNFKNKRILIMGLGLHGGGVETARFFASRGGHILCTDMKGHNELKTSLEALKDLPIHFVLGKHRTKDFDNADIIIKNPAVPVNSPFLEGRKNIETDISIFLKHHPSPLFAITGSKGKSTTATILHHLFRKVTPHARLGGNITVNPLSFLDTLEPGQPVVLELSSWQLADLRGRGLLKPDVAIITNLMRDHQNHYASFSDYESDKKVVFESAGPDSICIFPDDLRGRQWGHQCRGEVYFVREGVPESREGGLPARFHGGAIVEGSKVCFCPDAGSWGVAGRSGETQPDELLSSGLPIPGRAFRLNAAFAALAFHLQAGRLKEPGSRRRPSLPLDLDDFPGIPYRMELFLKTGDILFYDDTSATIPEATVAAVQAIDRPLVLIAGGQNKDLDFEVFTPVCRVPRRIVMLAGTATDKWLPLLHREGVSVAGPYSGMMEAVESALDCLSPGQALLLSPGAASFNMFRNEFHRGDEFKKACRLLTSSDHHENHIRPST